MGKTNEPGTIYKKTNRIEQGKKYFSKSTWKAFISAPFIRLSFSYFSFERKMYAVVPCNVGGGGAVQCGLSGFAYSLCSDSMCSVRFCFIGLSSTEIYLFKTFRNWGAQLHFFYWNEMLVPINIQRTERLCLLILKRSWQGQRVKFHDLVCLMSTKKWRN